MNKYLLLSSVSIMMVNSGCISNQKSQTEQSDTISAVQTDTNAIVQTNEDEDIIQMLKEFYIAYNKTWTEINDAQRDSLRQKYCSQRFNKESKEDVERYGDHVLEHDELICDFYTEDLETILLPTD